SDPLIRTVTQVIYEQWNGFLDITSQKMGLIQTAQGERFFIQVAPLKNDRDLDWLLVVAIPETDFAQEIQAIKKPILFSSLIILSISIIVGVIVYQWISQPIQSLTEKSKLLAAGELKDVNSEGWIQELNVLAQAFNQMSLAITGSLQELQQINERIEQQILERTEALRQNEERFRSLFEFAPLSIVLLSPQFPPQLLQANSTALDLMGISEKDLSQLCWENNRFLEYLGINEQSWCKILEKSRLFVDYETVYPRLDGSSINLQVRSFAIRDRQGSPKLVVLFAEDITERKRVEASLRKSEQLFRGIFENAPFGIVIMEFSDTPTPRYMFVNSLACRESGYSLEEIRQLESKDHILEADFQKSQALWRSLISGERDQYTYERQFRCKDRSLIWVRFHVFTVRTQEGNPDFIVSFSEDITERKQVEEQLAHLAAIVKSSVDAIFSTDLQGCVTSWNRSAENLYGYSASEAIGQPIASLILDPTLTLGPMHVGTRETIHRNKQREQLEVFLSVSPICNSQGEWIGLSWITRDIREKRELERMKREFVSIVSHELRTPLTSIHGSLTALQTGRFGSLSAAGERLVQIAEQSTTRLIKLINDILDLERLQSGKVDLDFQVCSADEIISRSIDTVQMIAEQNNIQILAEVQPNLKIKGDLDLLIQVVTNLLGNAIKFSPSSGQIWVTAESTNQEVHIRVQDQGRGIPQEKLEQIFERFQQVDASDSRKKGGSGLGLAICKLIVQQHGGRIWAESESGKGSTFHILFPLF
ncbi:MAG: PAS domain S-box protein, partial [Thermostichus sp. DG02_4_bins_136]